VANYQTHVTVHERWIKLILFGCTCCLIWYFFDGITDKLWCCKFEVVVSNILNCFFGFVLMDIGSQEITQAPHITPLARCF